MTIADRFTKDRASLFVWGLLALACVVMVMVARTGQDTAYSAQIDDARARGLSYANGVVTEGISAEPGEPLKGLSYLELVTRLQAEVFVDPTVARVRVWGVDGLLLFTTEPRPRSEEIKVTGDPGIAAAVDGGTFAQTVREPFTFSTTGMDGEVTNLLQTYSPLLVGDRITAAGAVQIDFLLDPIAEASESPWRSLQLVFASLAVVFLILTIVSFARRSRGRAAAVAEQPAEEAAGEAVVEAEAAVEEANVRDELETAREQLQQAEEAYRYLENRLKQAQAELAAKTPAAPGGARTTEIAIAAERQAEAERKAADAEARASRLEAELRHAMGTSDPEDEADMAPAPSDDSAGPSEPQPAAPRVATSNGDELARLEERLLAAERRAQEARERVAALSPEEREAEATELRERLARTAARKRGIDPSTDER